MFGPQLRDERCEGARAAAGGRSLTHAQYLAALVALHEATRTLAESGHAEVAAELERLGLTTVTV